MPRRLRFLALCLPLGLISTAAAAWFFATVPFRSTPGARLGLRTATPTAERLVIHRYDRRGTTEIYLAAGEASILPTDTNLVAVPADDLVPASVRSALVPWPWNSRHSRPGEIFVVRRVLIQGWPWPALWSSFEEVPNPNGYWGHDTLSGWTPDKQWAGFKSLFPPGDPPVTFPYRPHWPGLVADTALYAAAWAVVLVGISGGRRTLRRRRGHCPGCNYALAGLPPSSPCPECGHPPL